LAMPEVRDCAQPVVFRRGRLSKVSRLSYKDRWRIWAKGSGHRRDKSETREVRLSRLIRENSRLRKKFEKWRLQVHLKRKDVEILRNALEASNQKIWLFCDE
jgi:hypothetical protein